jgi:hypothetical protein
VDLRRFLRPRRSTRRRANLLTSSRIISIIVALYSSLLVRCRKLAYVSKYDRSSRRQKNSKKQRWQSLGMLISYIIRRLLKRSISSVQGRRKSVTRLRLRRQKK